MMKIGDEVIMRRHRPRRRKTSRKIIIITSVCLLFIMTAGYAAFSTNLNITAKGNILEKSRVIQSWNQTSNEDFHSNYYKENIVSATFLDTSEVPDNATESWNVSEDKEKGGVMAWVVPNSEDSTKYDLYIGANNGVIANENSSNLFYNFINMEEITFNDNFDTSKVTDMSYMFQFCYNLESLNISSFSTVNVTDMNHMFNRCYNLVTLDVSSFDTSNVTNMRAMFANCYSLTSLDLTNFKTSNVTNMRDMFTRNHNLTTLNITSFDTTNVTDMYGMFYYMQSLTELNICTFNTNKVTNMGKMFEGTTNLTSIKVGNNWTTTNADTTNMFTGSGVSSVTTGQCESISS